MADPLSSRPAYAGEHSLAAGQSLVLPIVVYALFLVALFTGGLSMIAGVIMAYVLRGEASPTARTHYTFLIRTFWGGIVLIVLGVLIILAGLPLIFVLIGIPMVIVGGLIAGAAHLWQIVRCGFGLWHAANGRSYPEPLTPLI